MKTLLSLLLFCLIGFKSFAQERFLTKTGSVNFEASVPSFEEVKAKNESTTAILNTTNGELAALVFVKAFRFKNALMEEHFNENYAESDKYPKANFKGKLSGFDISAITEDQKTVTYSGSLTFHGKTKTIENEKMTISKNSDDAIIIAGTFAVNVDDFNIEIPKIVSNKVSKTVDVQFSFVLKEK